MCFSRGQFSLAGILDEKGMGKGRIRESLFITKTSTFFFKKRRERLILKQDRHTCKDCTPPLYLIFNEKDEGRQRGDDGTGRMRTRNCRILLV